MKEKYTEILEKKIILFKALQTYEVLRKVGSYHDFSAGLIIGGKVALLSVTNTIFIHLFETLVAICKKSVLSYVNYFMNGNLCCFRTLKKNKVVS